MAKKRAKVDLDLSKASLFDKTEETPAKAKNVTPKHRLRGRATYDIGQELKEAIQEESVRLGVPASQLAKYLLLFAWDDYKSGRIPSPSVSPSKSPAYRNVIKFPE